MAQCVAESELNQATNEIASVELKCQGCRKAKNILYVCEFKQCEQEERLLRQRCQTLFHDDDCNWVVLLVQY